jgi:hypothetical protein
VGVGAILNEVGDAFVDVDVVGCELGGRQFCGGQRVSIVTVSACMVMMLLYLGVRPRLRAGGSRQRAIVSRRACTSLSVAACTRHADADEHDGVATST